MQAATNKDLISRLNRINGQILAVKKNLENSTTNCQGDVELIKAATNALKKFAQAYVEAHIEECFDKKKTSQIRKDLGQIVQSAFSM
ncbi:MAG: metal-sensing transcriptional repressor [Spirochaetia bacterium]|nr:metal-sensing transcriptional repressor [Spirochaetia bacterium]